MIKIYMAVKMNRISKTEKSGMNHNRIQSDDEGKDSKQ